MAKAKKTVPTDTVEIEVVIDRSGSMESIRNDAIGGFNRWLSDQQGLPGEANVTLTLFDHERKVFGPHPVKDVSPLTSMTYVPRGMTALNDAIGSAVTRLNTKAPKRAILVILTDGQENNSREFSTAAVRKLIADAEGRGWQVNFLSADLNAFQQASTQYGVTLDSNMLIDKTSAGLNAGMARMSATNAAYRAGDVTAKLQTTPVADNTGEEK